MRLAKTLVNGTLSSPILSVSTMRSLNKTSSSALLTRFIIGKIVFHPVVWSREYSAADSQLTILIINAKHP